MRWPAEFDCRALFGASTDLRTPIERDRFAKRHRYALSVWRAWQDRKVLYFSSRIPLLRRQAS